jgi:acetoin utilization protein AcuB
MLVRHFMTRSPITLNPDKSCGDALQTLRRNRIRRAPVVKDDAVVGIISERDLLRVLPGTVAQSSSEAGKAGMDTPVGQVMKKELKTLHPNDHLDSAARLMLQHKIGGIPVIENDKLQGIITESDIFKAIWKILSADTGTRIIFEIPGGSKAASPDYMSMCEIHGCRAHAFLRFPRPQSGDICYLRVEGENIEGLIDELWSKSCKVISVKKESKRH